MIDKTIYLGKQHIELEETESTNSYAQNYLKTNDNVPEGLIISAHTQSAGKGQRGNIWQANGGQNITCSIILKPTFIKTTESFYLSAAIANAMAQFVKYYVKNKEVYIKWPNDIFVEKQKIAGVLIENQIQGMALHTCIVGIGININQEIFDKAPQATSLCLETNKAYSISKCLEHLCVCIEQQYLMLRSNTQTVWQEYHEQLYQIGAEKIYLHRGTRIRATIELVQKSGRLQLRKDSGTIISADFQEIKYL